jgi:hypothetical protein
MLKEKYLNEMVEEQEQKQEEYAHERHMENTKTEQGNGNSERKCQKNFTRTHSMVLKMWQADRHGNSNRNISATCHCKYAKWVCAP